MTDKEKIRNEVKRLRNFHQMEYQRLDASDNICLVECGKRNLCDNLLEFIDSLREEPVSEDLEEAASLYVTNPDNWVEWIGNHGEIDDISYIIKAFKAGAQWGKNQAMAEIQAQSMALAHGCPKERISDALSAEIEEIWGRHSFFNFDLMQNVASLSKKEITEIAHHFTNWQEEHLWKPADGDDLPEIDREVVALLDNGKIVFAHRPPEYRDGKDIVTGKVTRNYVKTYDKGGWNIPNVAFWLDLDIPKL